EMTRVFEAERSRIENLPPSQRATEMNKFTERMGHLWDVLEVPQTPPQQWQGAPRLMQVPAPQRTQQFVYDITLDGRTYRLTMNNKLPTDARGRLDPVAARRALYDLLINNKLQTNPPSATVTMLGNDPLSAIDNQRPPNERLDRFRDHYTGQGSQTGEQDGQWVRQYTDDPDIRVTSTSTGKRRRGG